jgi:hypothetical protein
VDQGRDLTHLSADESKGLHFGAALFLFSILSLFRTENRF